MDHKLLPKLPARLDLVFGDPLHPRDEAIHSSVHVGCLFPSFAGTAERDQTLGKSVDQRVRPMSIVDDYSGSLKLVIN